MSASVTFLTSGDGGRQQPPDFRCGRYMPHIVVQPPDVRSATIDPDGKCREPYQGVRFVGGPDDYEPGKAAAVTFELMYFPDHPYEDVVPGATFTVREGGRIVGSGSIESRTDPRDPVRPSPG